MLSRAGHDRVHDPEPPGRLRALAPLAALRGSWRLLRQRPLATLGLSAGMVGAGASACCGLGLFAAPWLACELLALHIASARGVAPRRSAAWIAAAVVQLLGWLLLAQLALGLQLALGPEQLLDADGAPQLLPLLTSLVWCVVAAATALALGVHFEHVPALLIERGGSVFEALLESARLVARSGLLTSWRTSLLAHALPILLVGAALALQSALTDAPSALALAPFALPWLLLGVALGQGMLVASYLALAPAAAPRERGNDSTAAPRERGLEPTAAPREPLDDLPAVPRELRNEPAAAPPARVVEPSAKLPGSRVLLWLLLLPLVGPLLVVGALLRPSELTPGRLADGAAPLLDVAIARLGQELELPGSELRLWAAPGRVQVVASDGGGAGTLPLPTGNIERVRVASARHAPAPLARDGFAIEVQLAGGARYLTTIDESGVRRDDSLGRRFAFVLPVHARLLLLLCWGWLVIWLARVLPRHAALHVSGNEHGLLRSGRRAWLWLLPPALLAPAVGVWAWLR